MNKYQVLIVDDQPEITQSLEEQILKQNFDVKVAQSYTDGNFMVDHYNFDIAIIDLFLPDGNGIDLFRNLKKRNREIYTILITGNATIENATTALNEGINAYLIKPFSSKQLKTSLHQAEKTLDLRKENKALFQEIEKNKQFYEDLLNSTSEAILVVDLEYRIQFSNKAAQEIFQLTENQLLSQFLTELIDDGYKVMNYIHQQVASGKSLGGYRVGITVKNNKSFDAHLAADFLYDKNKQIEGLIINLTNPLIRDEVFNRIVRKEKLSTIVSLANTLSHEIRNPINILSGRLQLLLDDFPEEKYQSAFNTIQRQIDRILIITQLLNKFNISREDSIPENLNVVDTIKNIIAHKTEFFKKRNILISTLLERKEIIIEGNQKQIKDALHYLFEFLLGMIPSETEVEICDKLIKKNKETLWYDLQIKLPGFLLDRERLFYTPETEEVELNGLIRLEMTLMHIILNNYGIKFETFVEGEKNSGIIIKFPVIKSGGEGSS